MCYSKKKTITSDYYISGNTIMMEQKNNKLLYIDYMFMRGHVNFNRVHIDALLKEGYNVKLVLHKEIASLLPYAYQQYALVIHRI